VILSSCWNPGEVEGEEVNEILRVLELGVSNLLKGEVVVD